MIAIDTNVLLRYLLDDDIEQSSKANHFIANKGKVLVTDAVLVETIWTLRGKKYQLKKSELVNVIQTLFQEPNIRFENGQVVWLALNDYRNVKSAKGKEADFADALIVNKARYIAENQGHSFSGSYTFDRASQKIPGAKAP